MRTKTVMDHCVDRVATKTSMLFFMDLLFRAKRRHLLPDPCLIPYHTRTLRHRGHAQRHAFKLANCKVRESWSHLGSTQNSTETSPDTSRGSPSFPPPRASTYGSAVPDQVRGLAKEKHIQSADSVQKGPSSRNLEQSQCMMLLLTFFFR